MAFNPTHIGQHFANAVTNFAAPEAPSIDGPTQENAM